MASLDGKRINSINLRLTDREMLDISRLAVVTECTVAEMVVKVLRQHMYGNVLLRSQSTQEQSEALSVSRGDD